MELQKIRMMEEISGKGVFNTNIYDGRLYESLWVSKTLIRINIFDVMSKRI